MIVLHFLSSNFFTNLILLVTVLITILIYYRNKRTEIKNAASILILEIRMVEKSILDFKSFQDISKHTPVLPTGNWNKYKHMFISEFDRDELELIDYFYATAESIEKEISNILEYQQFSMKTKTEVIQKTLSDLALKSLDFPKALEDRKEYLKKFENESYWFLPNLHNEGLLKNLQKNFTLITTSSVGTKLKKLAKLQ